MKHNIVQEKSYTFALRIIKLYKYFCIDKKEYELSRKIIRSGTSIGANIEEAIAGQSEKDFLSKLAIAYKEARETHYWLRLLHDSDYIDDLAFDSIISECNDLLRIIGSIQKTIKIRNS
jgi:four helix bundle protein